MRSKILKIGMLVILFFVLRGICEEGRVVFDDFVRFKEQRVIELGVMSDGVHKWVKRVPKEGDELREDLIYGSSGRLYIGYRSGLPICDTGVAVKDFKIKDGVIELKIGPSTMKGRTNGAYINYRGETIDSAAGAKVEGAFHVGLTTNVEDWKKEKDITLFYGTKELASGNFADEINPEIEHTLTVLFEKNQHIVWFDGKKVIEFVDRDPTRDREGYIGFGGYYTCGYFNEFSVYNNIEEYNKGKKEVKEAYVKPIVQPIKPITFQNKPLFLIATYSTPDDEKEWEEYSKVVTVAQYHAVNIDEFKDSEKKEKAIKKIKEFITRCEKYNIPMMWYVWGEFSTTKLLTTPEEISSVQELFGEFLDIVKDHPLNLGYYWGDEPENQFYQEYAKLKGVKEWKQEYDKGFAVWLADKFKWVYDTIKTKDPDAYVFCLPGWWTTYKDLWPVYDVLMANEYPQNAPVSPLTGNLYVIIEDASYAAEAIRANGRTTFVYMPSIYEIIKNHRPGTYKEQRYCMFAPITQGAMGLNGWCLYRTTKEYRERVIYPTLREVKSFIPWYLGEWQDDKVSSDHDIATKDYLKKFPPVVKEIIADKGATITKLDRVPDCSHILRYNSSDNSYLLLAVNNCKEPIEVTFTFKDIPNLPGECWEKLEYYKVLIKDNQMKDTFQPYDVHAYIIKMK